MDLQKLSYKKHVQSDKTNPKCTKSFKGGQNHIKPTPPMYSSHNLHVQLSGFHTVVFDLKTDRVSEFFISYGREFHMTDQKYLNEFFPLRTLFTNGITRSCLFRKLKY